MKKLDTMAKQREFKRKAEKRAEHHAPKVVEIVPIVVEAVLTHADPGSIHGSLYNGALTGRSGWAEFGGRRVWGGYKARKVEFREGNRLGRAIARFDNDSSASEVERKSGA